MTTAIQTQNMSGDTMLAVVAGGDCSRLSPEQKLAYYHARCEAAGLDPRAQPFAFMKLQGKEILYALKTASDQLAAKNGVVCQIVSQVTEEGIRIVTVTAMAKDGRRTDEIGAVSVKGLTGDALCNAFMKAVTKAKRRATLSICGLGMLDETEIDTLPREHEQAESMPTLPPPVAHATKSTPLTEGARVWARAQKAYGKDARDRFGEAAAHVPALINRSSASWTADEAGMVEAILFPPLTPVDDVPGWNSNEGPLEPGSDG